MPNQTRPLTEPTNHDLENRMPHEYFVDKGLAENKNTDVSLQDVIWTFLEGLPGVDLNEIEVDIRDGVVTLMGTFTDSQVQGRAVHNIMRINGVQKVLDQTRLLERHQMMNSPGK